MQAFLFLRGRFFSGADGEMNFVTDKTQEAFAGGWRHDWPGLIHLKKFYLEGAGRKAQK